MEYGSNPLNQNDKLTRAARSVLKDHMPIEEAVKFYNVDEFSLLYYTRLIEEYEQWEQSRSA